MAIHPSAAASLGGFYDLIGQMNFRQSEAEAAFEELLEPTKVVVHKLAHLDKVEKDGSRIVAIAMEDGLTVRAKQFIGTTYDGDLLARAGCSATISLSV